MFKSKKELAQALLEGRKFRTLNGNTLFYEENAGISSVPFRFTDFRFRSSSNEPMCSVWDQYDTVTEILDPAQQLQEALNKGPILCYVWDHEETSTKRPAIVIRHKANRCYQTSTGSEWLNARSLTEEEAKSYLLELT